LAIAREQFIANGFRRTTMDAIAAGARISKQTLYAAHPSKDELYAAVVRDWVDQGFDAMRPHALALLEATNLPDGLQRFARALQTGVLSPAVMQMRTLVAAEAAAFPEVASDYVARSWDRNIGTVAQTFTALTARGLLTVDHPKIAAEQFVWLALGEALNRQSLQGAGHGYSERRLAHIAAEAVATFLSRYGPAGSPR
jgi:TetR/AcrR family transcriptional regulator, mexJK operon transcriptional repressor